MLPTEVSSPRVKQRGKESNIMEREIINVKQWQEKFINRRFSKESVRTQIDAGWYDWFCKDSSLKNKTYKMGKIIKEVKEGGKVDLLNWYVWFKNNCPLTGPLYDDFRFSDLNTGEVQLTIQIDCCWNGKKYAVYGRKEVGGEYQHEPLFETDNSKELVRWLNEPWEKEENAEEKEISLFGE